MARKDDNRGPEFPLTPIVIVNSIFYIAHKSEVSGTRLFTCLLKTLTVNIAGGRKLSPNPLKSLVTQEDFLKGSSMKDVRKEKECVWPSPDTRGESIPW